MTLNCGVVPVSLTSMKCYALKTSPFEASLQSTGLKETT